MPILVHGLRLTVIRLEKTVNCQLLTVNRSRRRRGFSLIELMVVIALFGIAASVGIASFVQFERNQRVRSAAAQLKGDLRLIQTNAHAGNKGIAGSDCVATSSLGGWYLSIKKSDTFYTIGGDCVTSSTESSFALKTINLPRDTKVNKIFHSLESDIFYQIAIFYQPLTVAASFHNGQLVLGSPLDFLDDSSGILKNLMSSPPQSTVTIQLSDITGTFCYQVKIELTGEVSDYNPTTCS